MTGAPLLDLDGLTVRYPGRYGPVRVVDGVSFAMGCERLGIVGQSGSGKSTVGRAVLRLLPPHAEMSAARLLFGGQDLLSADAARLRAIRGRRIGLILQDPKFSLNPMMKIGAQIFEAFRRRPGLSRNGARAASLEMLATVGFTEPARIFGLYPHEVSGGMGQRAMIAMMLAGDPDLLIADEPTSALDATARIELLTMLDVLLVRRNMGLILISHDLDLVAGFCDRVLVMQGGRIVERCSAADLTRAQHPYTRELLATRLPPVAR